MLPVTGPIETYNLNGIDGEGSWCVYKRGFRQVLPYDRPLSYRTTIIRVPKAILYPGSGSFGNFANASANTDSRMRVCLNMGSVYTMESDLAINSVAARAQRSIQAASASLGINLTQRQQTIDMITKRGKQLLRFFSDLRRGKIRPRLRGNSSLSYRIPRPRKGKKPPSLAPPPRNLNQKNSDLANLMLETQFGWVPFCEDVYNGLKLLSDPLPSVTFRVTGAQIGISNEYRERFGPEYYNSGQIDGFARGAARGEVWIENPDLYLLQRSGLLNLPAVLWDAVPWSFVVDWFVNVNQLLNSLTDYMGLGFRNASFTRKLTLTGRGEYNELYAGTQYGWVIFSTGTDIDRKIGLPPVKLRLKPFHFNLFNLRTTWALVVQKLPK